MADISQIKLPSGTTYDIKDSTARAAITGGTSFLGVTTTALTDGASTSTIVVGGNDVSAVNGGFAIYGNKEFVYSESDGKWHEFGDTSGLGDLAYKNTASGSYTPSGTVSQPTFSGNSTTSTGKFTPSGSVSFSNTNQTATVSKASSGDATYTPEGSVSAPSISVSSAGSTTTIKNPSAVTVAKSVTAAAPGATAPSNSITYYDVTGEVLSLYQIGYTTGDSITTENTTVKTGDASYSATAPTFTGTGARLVTGNISVPTSATFTGSEGDVSVSGTPSGTVSQPTFTGTQDSVTVS